MDYSTQVGGKMIIIIKSYTTAQPVVIVIRARGNTLNTRAGKKKKKRKRKKKQADCKTGEEKKGDRDRLCTATPARSKNGPQLCISLHHRRRVG